MNIEIANRLVELRKKAGLSQEELAEKIGLSRQAVSKWERAEASPDTDNLICLAKIYGVSLDDLLNTDQKVEDIASETKEREESKEKGKDEEEKEDAQNKKDSVHISINGVHVKNGDEEIKIDRSGVHVHGVDCDDDDDDEDDDDAHENALYGIISSGTLFLVGLIAYIIVGLLWTENNIGWAMGWTFILDGLWLASFFQCFVHKKVSNFLYPLLVTSAYCKLGFLGAQYGFEGWGFYWFLFITVPVFYIVANSIDKSIHVLTKKNKKAKIIIHSTDENGEENVIDV